MYWCQNVVFPKQKRDFELQNFCWKNAENQKKK